MMVFTGGQERTTLEYKNLLAKAGFRRLQIVLTPASVSILEACLVP